MLFLLVWARGKKIYQNTKDVLKNYVNYDKIILWFIKKTQLNLIRSEPYAKHAINRRI